MSAELIDRFIPTAGAEYYGGITGLIQSDNFIGMHRPYFDKNDRPAVTINTGRWTVEKGERRPIKEHRLVADILNNGGHHSPVLNATMLRKEEWLELDKVVLKAARLRLRAWSDLAAANTFGGFNGMAKMILEHETMSDPGEAVVDMDGLTDGRNDHPKFQLEGLPLPITHSDFWYSARKLAVSRGGLGTPLDTVSGEAAARRVAEMVEKTTIGVETGVTYGGASTQTGGYGRNSTVYGFTNFTNRLTKTNLTTPTGSNPNATVSDVIAMRQQLYNNKFYGPFMLYHSTDWDTYLDNDYAFTNGSNWATNPSMTLRDRLRKIEGIVDVRRLDFLQSTATAFASAPERITSANPFTLLMVQQTADVARAVIGMNMTTVQWESRGGMQLNFKVMCIYVPQLRADFNGNCGILHATTS